MQSARSWAVSAAGIRHRFPGSLTIAGGVLWSGAFTLAPPTLRPWLLAAAGYAIAEGLDAVAYRPVRSKKLQKTDTIAVYAVCVGFGFGLLVRSGLTAAVVFFAAIGCFGPAGVFRTRGFGRPARATTVFAAVAGIASSILAPRLAPAAAIALLAWLGVASVHDEPPADIGWAVARSTAAVARFAGAVTAFDLLADWRTAGAFRFNVWGEVAPSVAVGALVVFGLSVAAFDSRLRAGGVAIAATSAAIPYAFVGAPPGASLYGAAFGGVWVVIGLLRWFERVAVLPDVYPARLRARTEGTTRALA